MKKMLLVTGLLIPLLSLAADRLNVKTGLWEITTKTEMHGTPAIPPDVLAKMTPEQRAKMTAMFASHAATPTVHKRQECVTQQDLEQPFHDVDRKECQATVVKGSATQQDIKVVCSGEQPSTGTLHIETPTPESMKGLFDISAGEMRINTQLSGRWLGASCKKDNAG